MGTLAHIQAVDFNGIVNDPRYSIRFAEDNTIKLWAEISPEEGSTGIYHMDSNPVEEFADWDVKKQQAYLIGYMDARTDMAYLYDFEAPDYQRCYELGRTHGETDGIWDDTEEEA